MFATTLEKRALKKSKGFAEVLKLLFVSVFNISAIRLKLRIICRKY
jgi:hypothetical protein